MPTKLTWVAAQPGGALLAIGATDGRAAVWSIASQQSVPLAGNSWVVRTRWSPDGSRLLVGRYDGTVTVHDPDGAVLHTLHTGNEMRGLAWHPSGDRFATGGSDGLARVFDAESFETVSQEGNPDSGITCLAFAGDVLTVGWTNGAMTGWLPEGPVTLSGPFGREVQAVGAHPDGHTALFGGLWGSMAAVTLPEWEFGRRFRGVPPKQIAVNSIEWSPDGTRFLIACGDDAALLFSWREGDAFGKSLGTPFWERTPKPGWNEKMIVSCACFSPADEGMYTTHFDGTLRHWEAPGPGATTTWQSDVLLG